MVLRVRTAEFNYSDSGTGLWFSKELILISYDFETGAKGLFTLWDQTAVGGQSMCETLSITLPKDALALFPVKQTVWLYSGSTFVGMSLKVVAKS
jgi:hypothetical protein